MGFSSIRAVEDDENGTTSVRRIQLSETSGRRAHNLYVTVERDVKAIKNDVVQSLVEYLTQRFDIDKDVLSTLKPFVTFSQNAN